MTGVAPGGRSPATIGIIVIVLLLAAVVVLGSDALFGLVGDLLR